MAAILTESSIEAEEIVTMKSMKILVEAWMALLLGLAVAQICSAQEPERELLRQRIEQLQGDPQGTVHGNRIAALSLISDFYERRDFRLAWAGRPKRVAALMEMIDAADEDGLKPRDYHQQTLGSMLAGAQASAGDPRARVDLDLLLTDALVRLGYHMRYGKVDPVALDPDWNFRREDDADPVAILEAAFMAADLRDFVKDETPQLPYYHRLKGALARYHAIQAAGGWPQIPAGPALRPGMDDARIPALRARLVASGDLPATPEPPAAGHFDPGLEQAVRRFQHRHGLDADGVVGRQTLAAMNVPVGRRIDQIRVNMERARWVSRDLPEESLLVDIAGFRARLIRADRTLWDSRAQVGRAYRRTPVFRDQIRYIVLNPTWTVPPTILAQDILPKVRKDPAYLDRMRLRVLDRKGQPVDPNSVDWGRLSADRFPYVLRQDPGPNNALGRIKFMFPNPHLVYLHDTPHKALFEHSKRTFSSGCIRVERPFALAELLLDDPQRWSREKILEAIEAGNTQTVRLPRPIDILLLYWTVEVSPDGVVEFRPDVYGRDARVLAALDGAFPERGVRRPDVGPRQAPVGPGRSDLSG